VTFFWQQKSLRCKAWRDTRHGAKKGSVCHQQGLFDTVFKPRLSIDDRKERRPSRAAEEYDDPVQQGPQGQDTVVQAQSALALLDHS